MGGLNPSAFVFSSRVGSRTPLLISIVLPSRAIEKSQSPSYSSLSSPVSTDEFARTRASQAKGGTKAETAAGVGDDAFYWWDPKPGSLNQVGIAVRAGNRQLTVLDMTSSDSIASTKPRLLAVAKSLVPKLR